MAIQMGLIIGLSVWGGIQLDKKYSSGGHTWTLILSLTGVVLAIYNVIRDLLKS